RVGTGTPPRVWSVLSPRRPGQVGGKGGPRLPALQGLNPSELQGADRDHSARSRDRAGELPSLPRSLCPRRVCERRAAAARTRLHALSLERGPRRGRLSDGGGIGRITCCQIERVGFRSSPPSSASQASPFSSWSSSPTSSSASK